MAAVASVIRNRLAAGGGYGRSPAEIVHSPYQFEAWNPPGGTGPALTADPKSPAYRQAAALAQGVFRGVIQDQTGGATHFFAPAAQADLGRSVPGWAKGDPLASIGGHQFYAPSGCRDAGKHLSDQFRERFRKAFGHIRPQRACYE
jgi:spore germination cell wall hydrolase CwlJ-like protein